MLNFPNSAPYMHTDITTTMDSPPSTPPTSPAERRATSGPPLCHCGGGCVTTRTTNIFFSFFTSIFFPLEKGRNTAIFGSTVFFSAVGPCRVMREQKKEKKVSTQKTLKIKKKLSPKGACVNDVPKIKIGKNQNQNWALIGRGLKLLTTPVYFLEIVAKPKKSPGT